MDIGYVFDEYAKSFAIIKPLFKDDKCYDFRYIYVNIAFSLYLGISVKELIGTTFLEHFDKTEKLWLKAFEDAVKFKKSAIIEARSFEKLIKLEVFPVGKDYCGFFIKDFTFYPEDIEDIEHVTEMATKDFLTGTYNRFYLEEYLLDIGNKNIGITLFDINNLKVINDKYGHVKGDELILELVNRLNTYYTNSKIFRMGGDEFLVITTNLSKEEFLNMTENCKNHIHDIAAMGYEFYENLIDFHDSLAIVDTYMYQDKREAKKLNKID